MKCCDVVVKDEKALLHSLYRVRSDSATHFNFHTKQEDRSVVFFFFTPFCPQGVTLTDVKEAEKTLGKGADPAPSRTIQPVSPIVTVTPAERGE